MKTLAHLLIVCTIAFSIVLTGCVAPAPAQPEAQPEAATQEEAGMAEEEEAEPVTLRFAVFIIPAWMDFYTEKAQEFHELHPNITVETELVGYEEYFVDMAVQLAAGVGPDLIFVINTVNFPQFADAGYLVPLDPYIERDNVDLSDYVQPAIEGAKYEGQLYALPDSYHNGVSILYYNKTMFDEAGLDYPTEDWTYEDYMAAAEQLTRDTDGDGVNDQFGWVPEAFSGNVADNATFMRSFGCEWDDETGTQAQADSPECLNAVKFIADHVQYAPPYDTTLQRDSYFTSGQAAMITQGPWVLEGFRASLESLGAEVGTTKIPIGPAGRLSSGAAFGAHGITALSEHPDEAWEWVKWITNEENVQDFAALNLSQPARYSAFETWVDEFPLEAPAVAAVEYGAPPMNTPANLRGSEMRELIKTTLDGVWIGEKTPEEALSELQPQLQDLLDQPKP